MRIPLLSGEKPEFLLCLWIVGTDIIRQEFQCFSGENGIAVRTVLTPADINKAFGSMDVSAPEAAQLADPQPGGIQQCDLCLMFVVGERVNNGMDFINRGNFRKELVIAEIRNLAAVPFFMQDIEIKISQLRDVNVDRAVVQFSDVLEITQVRTDFRIGYFSKRFCGKVLFYPAQELIQIGSLGRDCIRGKIPEREDVEMFLDIISIKCVHGNSPP